MGAKMASLGERIPQRPTPTPCWVRETAGENERKCVCVCVCVCVWKRFSGRKEKRRRRPTRSDGVACPAAIDGPALHQQQHHLSGSLFGVDSANKQKLDDDDGVGRCGVAIEPTAPRQKFGAASPIKQDGARRAKRSRSASSTCTDEVVVGVVAAAHLQCGRRRDAVAFDRWRCVSAKGRKKTETEKQETNDKRPPSASNERRRRPTGVRNVLVSAQNVNGRRPKVSDDFSRRRNSSGAAHSTPSMCRSVCVCVCVCVYATVTRPWSKRHGLKKRKQKSNQQRPQQQQQQQQQQQRQQQHGMCQRTQPPTPNSDASPKTAVRKKVL